MTEHRVVLVDVNEASRDATVRRLGAQGYVVEATGDPVTAADMALSSPPAAFIADLWMPGISGVQLCRLLRTEPATAEVPVILRGESEDPRSRFWAERAGAVGYVCKGRTGELMRTLTAAVVSREGDDGFFMQLGDGSIDIRDRIAHYLDAALFESVVASEVRALAACGSFERLFDLLAQFLPQVIRYRWVSVCTAQPRCFAVHHHPDNVEYAETEARLALEVPDTVPAFCLVDEDACGGTDGQEPVVCDVPFAGRVLGQFALCPSSVAEQDTARLAQLIAAELGGPLRMAALMEEQQRLAAIDPLTGLRNRRSFLEQANVELARARRHNLPLCAALLDVDHFKAINDGRGHAAGDQVLSSIGELLRRELRVPDLAARWGGEEFVVLFPDTSGEGGRRAAERLRSAIEKLNPMHEGSPIPVTASIGIAVFDVNEQLDDLVNRADQGMYRAKVSGRNQVVLNEDHEDTTDHASQAPQGHHGKSDALARKEDNCTPMNLVQKNAS